VTLPLTYFESDAEKIDPDFAARSFTDNVTSSVSTTVTSFPVTKTNVDLEIITDALSYQPLPDLALATVPLPGATFKTTSESTVFDIRCETPNALTISDSRHAMLVEIINVLSSSLLVSLAAGVDSESVQFIRQLFPHAGLPSTPSAPSAIKTAALNQIVNIMGQCPLPIAGANQAVSSDNY
jgi:hypothetical protein